MRTPYAILADGWVEIVRADGARVRVSPDRSYACPCCGRWVVRHECGLVVENDAWEGPTTKEERQNA